MRNASSVALAVIVVLVSSSRAAAFYPDSIPNFAAFECLTCHTTAAGGLGCGGPGEPAGSPPCLNGFGVQFNNNGRVWNSTLANQNADGDAFTNGRELLDPGGLWDVGDPAPDGGQNVTNPGASNTSMSECAIGTVTVDGSTTTYATACSTNGRCNEMTGLPGYTCTCNAGYAGNGVTCSDVNECTMPVGRCGQGSCANSQGSFTCNCNTGYYFNGNTCSQDACVTNADDCVGPVSTCTPSPTNPTGAWTCGCDPGYTGRYTSEICVRDFGGFCLEWRPINWACTNIDECTSGSGGCPTTSACVDAPGSFTCMACGANAHVIGAVNAESCVCDAGFHGDPYVNCSDDDECMLGTHDCGVAAICSNVPGGFLCACPQGFVGDPHVECRDRDECASTKFNDCSENAMCENVPGSYTCTCRPFFSGNGRVCADVNECTNGTSGCGASEVCQNLYGVANTCECRPGYARASEGAPCTSSCGNGLRALREGCDDGNTTPGDGCSAECDVEDGYACYEPTGAASTCQPTCGDGLIDPPAEECDDGPSASDTAVDACRTTCERAHCGDGVLDTGETCDTGADVSDALADACRTTCVPAFCGDGVADTGERCDPGGGEALDPAECQRARCRPRSPDGGVGGDEGGGGCAAAHGSSREVAWALLGVALVLLLGRRRGLTRA